MSLYDTLNDAVLATFAEPFIYKGFGGDVLLQGVFGSIVNPESLGGIGFSDRWYTLQLLQAAVAANSIEVHRGVMVSGVDYQIIDVQADASGMATLTLRRY